jgi:hypothetical protein
MLGVCNGRMLMYKTDGGLGRRSSLQVLMSNIEDSDRAGGGMKGYIRTLKGDKPKGLCRASSGCMYKRRQGAISLEQCRQAPALARLADENVSTFECLISSDSTAVICLLFGLVCFCVLFCADQVALPHRVESRRILIMMGGSKGRRNQERKFAAGGTVSMWLSDRGQAEFLGASVSYSSMWARGILGVEGNVLMVGRMEGYCASSDSHNVMLKKVSTDGVKMTAAKNDVGLNLSV